MKTGYKVALTIGAIIALAYFALQDLILYRIEFFGTKTGIVMGIFLIIVGISIWVIDPIMSIFKK